MRWITRENVKVDRVACQWLIKRFVDAEAEFLFVPESQLLEASEREGATPFDATRFPELRLNHSGERCTFEAILEDFHLNASPTASVAVALFFAREPLERQGTSCRVECSPGLPTLDSEHAHHFIAEMVDHLNCNSVAFDIGVMSSGRRRRTDQVPGWLADFIELPMAARVLVRRVDDGAFEERIRHRVRCVEEMDRPARPDCRRCPRARRRAKQRVTASSTSQQIAVNGRPGPFTRCCGPSCYGTRSDIVFAVEARAARMRELRTWIERSGLRSGSTAVGASNSKRHLSRLMQGGPLHSVRRTRRVRPTSLPRHALSPALSLSLEPP